MRREITKKKNCEDFFTNNIQNNNNNKNRQQEPKQTGPSNKEVYYTDTKMREKEEFENACSFVATAAVYCM